MLCNHLRAFFFDQSSSWNIWTHAFKPIEREKKESEKKINRRFAVNAFYSLIELKIIWQFIVLLNKFKIIKKTNETKEHGEIPQLSIQKSFFFPFIFF